MNAERPVHPHDCQVGGGHHKMDSTHWGAGIRLAAGTYCLCIHTRLFTLQPNRLCCPNPHSLWVAFDSSQPEAREEALDLAHKLAAARSEAGKLRAAATRAGERAEAAELVRADAEVAAEQLRTRLEQLLSSTADVAAQRQDMTQVMRLHLCKQLCAN